MPIRRISVLFVVWFLVAGASVALAVPTTITSPEVNEVFSADATIAVEGMTDPSYGTVVVKLKRGIATIDSQICTVAEEGEYSHNFDAPQGGWPTGDYVCEVSKLGVPLATRGFEVEEIE